MNIVYNHYPNFIGKISRVWVLIILAGLVLLMNVIIFPSFMEKGEKPLDTRFFYTPEYASDYVLQMEGDEKIRSVQMHGTVDIIYPIIYTLLFSCIIFYLKGSRRLVSFPLFVLFADLLENISIILSLSSSPVSTPFKIFILTASISTLLKWILVLLCFSVIMFLIIRRIHEKIKSVSL